MQDQEIIDHLKGFIELINTDRNPHTAAEAHGKIPDEVCQRWRSWGLAAEIQNFKHFEFTGKNVYVGPKYPDKPFIIVIAHHDTVPNTLGLADNGSGMALLDLLAYWYSGRKETDLNIAFCMNDFEESDPRIWSYFESWSAEEGIEWADLTFSIGRQQDKNKIMSWITFIRDKLPDRGSFLGARYLKKQLEAQNMLDKMEVLLNLETIGFTADLQILPPQLENQFPPSMKGEFLTVVANTEAESWAYRIAAAGQPMFSIPLVVKNRGYDIPDTRRADSSVYWDEDLPAILLTDTANLRNPHYHRPSDIHLDYPYMAKVARVFMQAIRDRFPIK